MHRLHGMHHFALNPLQIFLAMQNGQIWATYCSTLWLWVFQPIQQQHFMHQIPSTCFSFNFCFILSQFMLQRCLSESRSAEYRIMLPQSQLSLMLYLLSSFGSSGLPSIKHIHYQNTKISHFDLYHLQCFLTAIRTKT